MQSSNGLTLTCRPRGGWVSDQDFEALKKDGYGYNSTEFCKLEVAVGSSPTLADALKVGALQVAYEDGKCVVTARAYFPYVNVHTGFMNGYTYQSSYPRWTKPMTPAEFQELQALAPKTADPTEWIKHAVERKITRLQDCCSVGMDEQSTYKHSSGKMTKEEYRRWLARNQQFIASLPMHLSDWTPEIDLECQSRSIDLRFDRASQLVCVEYPH